MSHRIAILLRALPAGGVERVMLNLAQGLLAEGHQVDLVLFSRSGELLGAVPDGVRVISLDGSASLRRKMLSAFVPTARNLIRYLNTERPALVVSSKEQCNVMAVVARMMAGHKPRLALTRHVPLDPRIVGTDARWYVNLFYRHVLHRADALVAVSEGIADEIRPLVPARARQKIRVIRNPVIDRRIYELAANEPVAFAPANRNRPLIVSAGRLTYQKGFDILLDAFALLTKTRDASLALLGEGELRAELESHARLLGIEERVTFLGHQDNPFAYLKRADLFVMSSRWEGLPTVLIEALALGVPVVSTDCRTGPAEILGGGKLGRLVPPGDAEALAEAMGAALEENPTPPRPALDVETYMLPAAVSNYLSLLEEPDREAV